MITYTFLSTFLSVIALLTQFLPVVTSLPFGADQLILTMAESVRELLIDIPFLAPLWGIMLSMVLVETSLFAWHWIKWLIERIH